MSISNYLIVGALFTTTLLNGCGNFYPFNQPKASTTPSQQRCNPNAAQWAVGKTNTADTVEQARQKASAYMVRILHPDHSVDLNQQTAGQLILIVNESGRITHAFCR